MPGGAGLKRTRGPLALLGALGLLAGCLREPEAPARALVHAPIDAGVAVSGEGGTASVAGRVSGPCEGAVIVEAVDGSGQLLGRARAKEGRWQLSGLAQAPARLRWGCDNNGDGYVSASAVAEGGPPRLSLQGAVLVLPAG